MERASPETVEVAQPVAAVELVAPQGRAATPAVSVVLQQEAEAAEDLAGSAREVGAEAAALGQPGKVAPLVPQDEEERAARAPAATAARAPLVTAAVGVVARAARAVRVRRGPAERAARVQGGRAVARPAVQPAHRPVAVAPEALPALAQQAAEERADSRCVEAGLVLTRVRIATL